MTADAPFSGIGPSRVNPYTGQILDADILLNSNVVEHYEYLFETMTPEAPAGDPDTLFGFDKLHFIQLVVLVVWR